MDWYNWKQITSTTTPTRLVFIVPGSLDVLQSFSFQLLTVRKSQTCRCRDTLQNVASISNKLYLSNNGDRMETKQLNIHIWVNRTQISSDGTADSLPEDLVKPNPSCGACHVIDGQPTWHTTSKVSNAIRPFKQRNSVIWTCSNPVLPERQPTANIPTPSPGHPHASFCFSPTHLKLQ